MSTQGRLSPILTLIVGGAGLVLIIAGLRQTAEILNPLLLAWVVAICVVPLLGWLQSRGVPGWLAAVRGIPTG